MPKPEEITPINGVSVVLCCFNSASRILPTMSHLLNLEAPIGELPIEIVIVDNGCSDETISIAKDLAEKQGAWQRVKVVPEPRKGVGNARKTGVLAAQHEVVIFCDDDNWLDRDYANIAVELLTKHSDVAIAGGNSRPAFESPPPKWLAPISGAWALQENPYSGYMGDAANRWTAGLILRRSVFVAILDRGYEFLCSTGLPHMSLSSGEDTELCLLVKHWNWKLYFDQRLYFTHSISSSRVTWEYARKLWKGFGAATILNDAMRLHLRQGDGRNWLRSRVDYQILKAASRLIRLTVRHMLFGKVGSEISLSYYSQLGRFEAIWHGRHHYRDSVTRVADWFSKNKAVDSRGVYLPASINTRTDTPDVCR